MIIPVLIFALILIGYLVFGYIDFEVSYVFLILTAINIFRSYMEWKNNRGAKKYILWIFYTAVTLIFFLSLEFVFNNPVPVKVEADQVEKIAVESLKYGETETITVTDKEFIESVVTAVEKGSYKMGRMSAFNPRLEITIIRDDGREISIREVIREVQFRSFMVSTKRFLFPEEMIMLSQELGIIFDEIANKIEENH